MIFLAVTLIGFADLLAGGGASPLEASCLRALAPACEKMAKLEPAFLKPTQTSSAEKLLMIVTSSRGDRYEVQLAHTDGERPDHAWQRVDQTYNAWDLRWVRKAGRLEGVISACVSANRKDREQLLSRFGEIFKQSVDECLGAKKVSQ